MTQRLRVVACLAVKGSRIFMAQRLGGGLDAYRWELPGGKVKAGESDGEALKRELFEELGVTARIGQFVGEASHGDIDLFVYRGSWTGRENGLQGQETGWFTVEEIAKMDTPRSDAVVIKGLQSLTQDFR